MSLVKTHFSITINAPKEKVWDSMLNDVTYREWTSEFNPSGSYFKGDWTQGSKILFVGPDDKGNIGGMVSRIKENKLHEFVSIEHLGELKGGVEDTISEDVQKWKGALENYTFKSVDGGTELIIEVDVTEDFKDYMTTAWPKALQKLKEICERG